MAEGGGEVEGRVRAVKTLDLAGHPANPCIDGIPLGAGRTLVHDPREEAQPGYIRRRKSGLCGYGGGQDHGEHFGNSLKGCNAASLAGAAARAQPPAGDHVARGSTTTVPALVPDSTCSWAAAQSLRGCRPATGRMRAPVEIQCRMSDWARRRASCGLTGR